ncbi:pyridoxamine 5'-phosphate oxidase family protein [Alisedimentitalea sp. MJ-SS2]|uniref:pyridoxamine 5'-phosphate oxidase family protein n=1 Tax=Aliisedimentitalea sp. MJ-SS2 TaxID=3049795 RepID=UPI00290F3A2A|nr:pyridoxamine 5'-phosphate oxidase family protein [Alisedimentitalea sp. MJ-SS2]MDU8928092.1 pyridoxamine 5'-phosphate oxidase family protein [Alisedimentitalea sp. MJ-SS2]
MKTVTSIEELETLYSEPVPASLTKVTAKMTPLYRQWIEASKFVVVSSVGPEGTDASPRGDDGPVVRIADEQTVLLPDWKGNNRIDTLRNIVRDDRVSLMFMVPGCTNVVRINGTAVLAVDEGLRESFAKGGKLPATVIVVRIGEMYFQCAKAIMRANLWGGDAPEVPTAGQFIKEMKSDFDAEGYDSGYPEYAKGRFW